MEDSTMGPAFEKRRDRLRERMAREGADRFLVLHAANRYYLSGFELHDPQCNESAGALLIDSRGDDWLLTDPRYEEAACRVWSRERVFIYKGKRPQAIAEFLKGGGPVHFEPSAVTIDFHEALSPHVALTPARGWVEDLRALKEEDEVEALRRSCAVNHGVMEWVARELLRPGMTEEEAAWEIEKRFRENGASELAFSPIVAVGPNGALPHAIPGSTRMAEESPLLVDVGGRVGAYCSDQTRTFWVGKRPSQEFERTMALVREAQERAIAALRPGLQLREAYETAMRFFQDRGVGSRFTHSLGHGIGLETHEYPSLGPTAEGTLKEGMVVTVEPGLYYPQWGGVRWEYMVLITADGAQVL
jgi:Xaa-Pro aminopeptidase